MRSIAGRALSAVATLLLLSGFASPSRAELVVTLVAAPGTDLSYVHVGDTLEFYTIGSSSNPGTGEYLTSFPIVHLFYTSNLDFMSGVGVPGWNNLLDTQPTLGRWTLQANAAGDVEMFNGFSDCNGLPNDTTGCGVTNVGATRPADSNHLTFTVHELPEPSSIGLAVLGFAALGLSRRRGAR